MKKYKVKLIYEFTVEANDEEEAASIVLELPNSQAKDCYLETEENYD